MPDAAPAPDRLPDHFRPGPVLAFVLITFAATWGVEGALIADGLRFDDLVSRAAPAFWLMGVMWIPGLAALLVTLVAERTSPRDLVPALSLRMGSIGPYFLGLLLIPVAYAVMYGLTWAAGLSGFDPDLRSLSALSGTDIGRETALRVMLPLSIFLGPLINFVFGLGEELGWRGFLLPRLMPLGKPAAHLVLGLLWGLWHAPLIWAGLNYPGQPVQGIVMMCLVCLAFGAFLNEMTLHYRSSILAGFLHGAANAQGYGIWMWMFPDAHPLLGGAMGLIGVLVWTALTCLTIAALRRLRR
ncbi:Abortive infection protein [Pseudodesulfovibrio mercurii]|uniref:Abortive infection protein n=1 Tax=Pseudodesulfovibrio mercurii TaxID=641491 RepID=F0JII1_9BACT|nr:CPBP family intramembrane glutamic endopeptidase [Pseudodesulfovibrio mercurii]EGB14233.1 Abortive infection protein [Pseudodesulfovibrio mercurii]